MNFTRATTGYKLQKAHTYLKQKNICTDMVSVYLCSRLLPETTQRSIQRAFQGQGRDVTSSSAYACWLPVLQLSNMELTKQQSNVMAALKQGNEALKKAHQEVRNGDCRCCCCCCCTLTVQPQPVLPGTRFKLGSTAA